MADDGGEVNRVTGPTAGPPLPDRRIARRLRDLHRPARTLAQEKITGADGDMEQMEPSGMDAVRADLSARIAALDVRAPYARPCELAPDIDAIRVIAHRSGLNPAVTVAHFVDSALSRGERGALVHGWLSLLTDAVACERQDLAACDAFAAACSVRLAG